MWKVFGPEKEVQGDLEVALFDYDLLSRALLKDLERSGVSRFRFGEVFEASLGSKIDRKSIRISCLHLMRFPNQPNLDFCRMSLAKCSFLKPKGRPKRGSQGTILGRKIDVSRHQKSVSNF